MAAGCYQEDETEVLLMGGMHYPAGSQVAAQAQAPNHHQAEGGHTREQRAFLCV